MPELTFPSAKSFQIAIFIGCDAPLERLNLSDYNLKFVSGINLLSYAEDIAGERARAEVEESANQWIRRWPMEKIVALGPISLDESLRADIYAEVERCLLILFPSEFRHFSLINFRVYQHSSVFAGEEQTSSYPSQQRAVTQPLKFQDDAITDIERFIKLYLSNTIPSYLRMCINNYSAHFYQWDKATAFLSLCICLETTSEGKDSIIYKIRRNLSIINGKSKEESDNIYRCIGIIYDLRSQIVHGETYEAESISAYIPYTQNLVASTIVELLIHSIQKREELNNILTRLGFGQKDSLSKHYDPHLANIFCNINNMTIDKIVKKNAPTKSK